MSRADLDLLLIKPGSQKALYGDLSVKALTAIEPPLWTALIATFVRNRGFSVRIIDAEAERLDPDMVADRVQEAGALVTAIVVSGTNPSASTMNMIGTRAVLEALGERAFTGKTLITGLHASALPVRTMEEERCDFVCEGEGFYTIADLIDLLKKAPDCLDFDVKGLLYRKNGEVIRNPKAPLVKELDKDLPIAAWDLLPMDKYRAHNWHCFQEEGQKRQPYGVLFTSLGCPFTCNFCCINAIFGGPGIRYRSPQKVIEEIGVMVNDYGIKNIKIIDEMFVLKEAHVLGICDLIIERGYDLNIWAYARVNTVNEKMLRRLKEAGVNWLAYGIESGSDRVLKSVTKGITVEKTKEIIRLTQDIGINVIGNYIVGLPEDDMESMKDTMKLATDLNCEFLNLYCATAYPGSDLYDMAVRQGWELPESWAAYSPYAYEHLPLRTNYLSSAEVLRFRDEAYVKYCANEKYLSLVKDKFGAQVARDIKDGLTTRLKRRLLDEGGQ